MKYYQFILPLLAFFVFVGCRPTEDETHHYRIPFFNNSEKDLYVCSGFFYPDTTASAYKVLYQPNIYKTKVNTINEEALNRLFTKTTYEAAFTDDGQGSMIRNDTLMVFVFDAERLENREPKVHVSNYLLVRYDLSLLDLQRLNWLLVYPPSESMKTIKMWPRYEDLHAEE